MPSSPSERTHLALHDIRANILLAQSFVSGMTLATFVADRRSVYAVTRCLEIVSEAARRLPEDMRARHPAQPWRAIMGAGNVYRHDYDNVAEDFIWRTVQQNLPALRAVVEQELATF